MEWKAAFDDVSWNAVGNLSIRLLGGQEVGARWLAQWHLQQRGYSRR